jgi:ATP-dependent exoDNAse (exonuclease V) alpha subunit
MKDHTLWLFQKSREAKITIYRCLITLLFRNLIHTRLTRGKQLVIFVGSRKALAMAVSNNQTVIRQTAL